MSADNSTLNNIIYHLARKSSGKSEKLLQFFGIDPAVGAEVYPLTRLQRDIYLDVCINPGTKAYNIGDCIYLDKAIDIKAWTQALNVYVNAYAPYRTSLVKAQSVVYQYVLKHLDVVPAVYDLSDRHHTPAELDDFVRELINAPFALYDNLLPRHFVLKLSGGRHAVGIAVHQLFLDGTSGKLLFETLSSLYEAIVRGGPLPDLTTKCLYKEYVFLNNELFDNPETVAFWGRLLEGCSLPPANRFAAGECKRVTEAEIGAEDFARIKALSWKHKITPSFYLRTVFSLLLRRVLAIGEPFLLFENRHGRSKDFLNVPGTFLYSEPLRVGTDVFADGSAFADWVDYFRDYREETKKYQHISFRTATGLLTRKDGITCFFNYLKYANVNFLGEKRSIHPFESAAAKEMHFFVEEKADGFRISLFYDESNFEYASFLERFLFVSAQILDREGVSVGDLDFVLPAEKQLVLEGFQGERVPLPYTFCALFEAQVTQTPLRPAVTCQGRSLTYRQLNEKANALAHCLVSRGVTREAVVAVIASRTEVLLVSLIAILKAGVTYLPIDPALPAKHKAYVLADAAPALLLREADQEDAPDFDPARVINPELEMPGAATENLAPTPGPADLAYVIYTSGSTGKPKGVMIEHGGLVNHLHAKVATLGLTGRSVVAQNASQGFDISIWQFLAPLLVGGSTAIYPAAVVQDPEVFIDRMAADGVTVLQVVPSYLQVLLDYLATRPEALPLLAYLVVTGEELKTPLAKRWFGHFPSIPLVNAYGPTEASDDVTHHVMHAAPTVTPVPIGVPVQNTNMYVIGLDGRPCPLGMKGEIYVSGAGVARGYLNAPERTAAAFRDGFAGVVTGRLYRTGDTGARLPDGTLAFYGRQDSQVKIHGYRVALGEIEDLLGECDGVDACVVLNCRDNRGDNRIVAFYTGSPAMDVLQLRKHLKSFLPEAVLPAAFVALPAFPLTANGKIDKTALEKHHVPDRPAAFEEASTPTEKQLQCIWQEVLDRKRVGVADNFFEIGGHSLTAMQIMQQIQEKFNTKLPLKSLFQHVTIKELAHELEVARLLNPVNQGTSAGESEEFLL